MNLQKGSGVAPVCKINGNDLIGLLHFSHREIKDEYVFSANCVPVL